MPAKRESRVVSILHFACNFAQELRALRMGVKTEATKVLRRGALGLTNF
jgi:hypothetical protein